MLEISWQAVSIGFPIFLLPVSQRVQNGWMLEQTGAYVYEGFSICDATA